jgi:RNA polymerase sigma factor (sigma-70 family)
MTMKTDCHHPTEKPDIYYAAKKCLHCRNQLIMSVFPLVYKLAVKYHIPRLSEVDDLAQDAVIKLAVAVDMFDPSLGYAWTTYASTYAMTSFSNTNRHAKKYDSKIQQDEESCQAIDEQHLFDHRVNTPLHNASLNEHHACMSSGSAMAIKCLPDRSADIVRRRYGMHPYGMEQTYREIAEHYGLTKERVRQIINDAHDQISTQLHAAGFPQDVQRPD